MHCRTFVKSFIFKSSKCSLKILSEKTLSKTLSYTEPISRGESMTRDESAAGKSGSEVTPRQFLIDAGSTSAGNDSYGNDRRASTSHHLDGIPSPLKNRFHIFRLAPLRGGMFPSSPVASNNFSTNLSTPDAYKQLHHHPSNRNLHANHQGQAQHQGQAHNYPGQAQNHQQQRGGAQKTSSKSPNGTDRRMFKSPRFQRGERAEAGDHREGNEMSRTTSSKWR